MESKPFMSNIITTTTGLSKGQITTPTRTGRTPRIEIMMKGGSTHSLDNGEIQRIDRNNERASGVSKSARNLLRTERDEENNDNNDNNDAGNIPNGETSDNNHSIANGAHAPKIMTKGTSFYNSAISLQPVEREAEIASIHLSKLEQDNKCLKRIVHFLDKYFMLLGLIAVVAAAEEWPIGHNDGIFYPHITSGWIATIILFFGLGLGFKITYLKRACLFWQMNVFCHLIIFGYFPLMGFSIKQLIQSALPPNMVSNELITFLDGTIILCCLPATAASAVVFTHNARGNEAAAAINCTLANLIGLFLSPLLILMFMGTTQEINATDIFMNLSLRVLVPFFVAQIIRAPCGRNGERTLKNYKIYIRKLNEFALLYMIFCALSESFYTGWNANEFDIFCIVVVIFVLHLISYVMIWYLASLSECCMFGQSVGSASFLTFTAYDRIGMMYSGVSKSMIIGIPLIEIMYEKQSNIGLYIVPILLYKPLALIIGTMLEGTFKRKIGKERAFFLSMTSTKDNRLAYETFISNLSTQTDYGALESLDMQSMSKWSQWSRSSDSNSGNEKIYDVDNTRRLARHGIGGAWARNTKMASNYITLME